MSLLSEARETCVLVNRSVTDDGVGGYAVSWIDGAHFQAAIAFDNSLNGRVAEKQGVTDVYKVITTKDAYPLAFHDVFRRVSDGAVFRVTTNALDEHPPKSAGLNMMVCRAEKWVIPDD